MIYNVYTALSSLKPKEKWTWSVKDYSGLEWKDTGSAPSESEINAELTRLTNAEPMRLLRAQRDKLLAACDWRDSSDLTLTDAWRTYRQALRDLPASSSPKLDSNGDLDYSSVSFPTEPN